MSSPPLDDIDDLLIFDDDNISFSSLLEALNDDDPSTSTSTVDHISTSNTNTIAGSSSSSNYLFMEAGDLVRTQSSRIDDNVEQIYAHSVTQANKTVAAQSGEAPIHIDEAAKKLDHNAKERIRRMKLNASFLSLRSLLPNSHPRSKKKKWTAPVVIDKVLEYIPELEKEIEKLNLKKDDCINLKKQLDVGQSSSSSSSPTVSVSEVKEGEVIVQICIKKSSNQLEDDNVFSKLIRNVEQHQQGNTIISASTIVVSHDTVCYHLHIQMNKTPLGPDYSAELRDKVISWVS